MWRGGEKADSSPSTPLRVRNDKGAVLRLVPGTGEFLGGRAVWQVLRLRPSRATDFAQDDPVGVDCFGWCRERVSSKNLFTIF